MKLKIKVYQLVIISYCLADLVLAGVYHGQPIVTTYNFWITLAANALIITFFIGSGIFKGLLKKED